MRCDNNAITMMYQLIQSDVLLDDEKVISYGIKAISPDGSSVSIPDVSTDISVVKNIVDICDRNCVSLLSIHDVVEDFLI